MERIERFDTDFLFLTHGMGNESYYRSHHHKEFEIFLPFEGEPVIRRVGGYEYNVAPGNLLFIPPGVSHDHRVLSKRFYNHISIHIESDFLTECGGYLFRSLFTPQQACYHDDSGLASLFAKSLLECMNMDRNVRDIAIKGRIISLLSQVYNIRNGKVAYRQVSRNKRIVAILDYIYDNLDKPLSLDTLSRFFAVNKDHLNELFRKETDCSIERYIRYMRLGIARQRISTGYGAEEAAYSVGFNEYSAFFRAYKAYFGETPTKTKADATALSAPGGGGTAQNDQYPQG
jgi:AraC-like DNA-binding protein/uncharacterized RmlC-like cupin family protein